jgi:hypothetical protein
LGIFKGFGAGSDARAGSQISRGRRRNSEWNFPAKNNPKKVLFGVFLAIFVIVSKGLDYCHFPLTLAL